MSQQGGMLNRSKPGHRVLSSTQLTAAILTSGIATAGTAQVTVFNPAPGGGTSKVQTFTINSSNPLPTTTVISRGNAYHPNVISAEPGT